MLLPSSVTNILSVHIAPNRVSVVCSDGHTRTMVRSAMECHYGRSFGWDAVVERVRSFVGSPVVLSSAAGWSVDRWFVHISGPAPEVVHCSTSDTAPEEALWPDVVHYGASDYNPRLLEPIENGMFKPEGGLWASPVGSENGWSDWCQSEMPHWCTDEKFTLRLNHDAKVVKIDSVEDLLGLPTTTDKFGEITVDWALIGKTADAIWLTAKGQMETRRCRPVSTYGWDVESVLIINPNCCYQL